MVFVGWVFLPVWQCVNDLFFLAALPSPINITKDGELLLWPYVPENSGNSCDADDLIMSYPACVVSGREVFKAPAAFSRKVPAPWALNGSYLLRFVTSCFHLIDPNSSMIHAAELAFIARYRQYTFQIHCTPAVLEGDFFVFWQGHVPTYSHYQPLTICLWDFSWPLCLTQLRDMQVVGCHNWGRLSFWAMALCRGWVKIPISSSALNYPLVI